MNYSTTKSLKIENNLPFYFETKDRMTDIWGDQIDLGTTSMERVALEKDLRYIDEKGNLLRTRTELSVSKFLSNLGHEYKYNFELALDDVTKVNIDFNIGDKLLEVVDSDLDLEKFKLVKKLKPDLDIIAVGQSKYAAKVSELDAFYFYDSESDQTSSIFIEDPSLAFDYAHILPLVEKCSILHGHTSTVMVEIIGKMINNLVLDFGEAKKIIKETLESLDHKFFISRKYLEKEDDTHYLISFAGPKGQFRLELPKNTTFVLDGEATVETLSTVIIKLMAPKMPHNIEALGVYIYEGVNKGAHIISEIKSNK
jgi:6-pyruvoyltetrahydropterin/6-carboxytetrahydropterin synthase